MSSKLAQFREMMAENGVEMTLTQAEKVLEAAKKFVRAAKSTSQRELWEALDCLTPGSRTSKLVELIEHAKEL